MLERFDRELESSARLRLEVFVLLILLFTWAGILVGCWVYDTFERKDSLAAFQTVTAASVVIAAWKIIAEYWRAIHNFLKDANAAEIHRPLGQVAIVATGLAMIGSIQAAPPKMPDNAAMVILPNTFITLSGSNANASIPNRVSLPFFSASADSNSECTKQLADLAKLDVTAKAIVHDLACGLRSCSQEGNQAVVDVMGFASSRPFECDGNAKTDENLRLAEMRRTNVISELRQSLTEHEFCRGASLGTLKIKGDDDESRWHGDKKAMEHERAFNDQSSGKVLRTHEVLTRRVDIIIEDAGACEIVLP